MKNPLRSRRTPLKRGRGGNVETVLGRLVVERKLAIIDQRLAIVEPALVANARRCCDERPHRMLSGLSGEAPQCPALLGEVPTARQPGGQGRPCHRQSGQLCGRIGDGQARACPACAALVSTTRPRAALRLVLDADSAD
jgi:hypothetical protein